MTLKPGRVLHASSKKMHGVMQKNRNASGVKNANAKNASLENVRQS